jgi:VWFA-related protein
MQILGMRPLTTSAVLLAVACLTSSFLVAQNPATAQQSLAFRSNVRVVLLDVVVTDNKDQPVTGLPKEQFQVFEDGKLQTLASFEEHAGLPELTGRARLPPNVFSNVLLAKAGDPANVLLLDSLNTPLSDQSYVHAQMVKYMKDVRPGTRMAIFALGSELRFVQGFTSDVSLLMAALNGNKAQGNPQLSERMETAEQSDASQQLVESMEGVPGAQASAAALRTFLSENQKAQTNSRLRITLEAIEQLARYLGGIPGRKNVIWFATSFPVPAAANDVTQDDLARTANLMTASEVSLYPIDAAGVAVDQLYDFSNVHPPSSANARQMQQYQGQQLHRGAAERNLTHAAMDEFARESGGEAIYNSNSLNEDLAHVINVGTHYYTLTYSPTNLKMDGELRRLDVRVGGGKYHVASRRGYYATDQFLTPVVKTPPKGDPLRPLMDHGTPDATEILYTMKVVPAATRAGPDSGRAGDNDKLKGAVTRYSVTFTLSPDRLALDTSADGMHHGRVEVTLLSYDRDGTPLNWMVRILEVRVPREHYEQAEANGVGFNLEFDMPAACVYLRSGLYDMGSNKAGTLEIPLAAVVASAAAGK